MEKENIGINTTTHSSFIELKTSRLVYKNTYTRHAKIGMCLLRIIGVLKIVWEKE